MPPPSTVLTSARVYRRGSPCETPGEPKTMCVWAPSRSTCRTVGGVTVGAGHRGGGSDPRGRSAQPVSCEDLQEVIVRDVASRCHDGLRRMVGPIMEFSKVAHTQPRDALSSPEDRISVWVATPQRLVVQLEDEVIRGVLHHADLFEYDLSLELEVSGAQQGGRYTRSTSTSAASRRFASSARA